MLGDSAASRHGIVIVGAGIAGLAAANELERRGVTDFIVIEAQNRIGGRVHTVDYDGRPLELGAQYVHGNKGNPVFALAASHKLLVNEPPSDEVNDVGVAATFRTMGGHMLSEPACREVAVIADKIQDRASKLYRSIAKGQSARGGHSIAVGGCHVVSMGAFWRREYDQYLNSSSCESDDDITMQMKVALHDWHNRWQAVENACNSLDDLSLELWGMYVVRGGDYELSRGYSKVVETLVTPAIEQRIWLNSPVLGIDWSACQRTNADCTIEESTARANSERFGRSMHDPSAHTVDGAALENRTEFLEDLSSCSSNGQTLEVTDGDSAGITLHLTDGRTLVADHVVVTLSIGCLQRAASTFFVPPLPPAKKAAIEKLQFGTTNKIYLVFDKPFWNSDSYVVNFVWLDGDIEEFQRRLNGAGKETPAAVQAQEGQKESREELLSPPNPWWRSILQFHALRHHPRLLEGWIAGSGAEEMELVDEESVTVTCWQLLRNFQSQDIPRPTAVIRTQWHSNKYVCGSYSSTPPGLSEKDVRAYAKPIYIGKVPRLLFAGEGTHVTDYSTVHGAYMSGVDAAQRLSDYGGQCERAKPPRKESSSR